MKKIFLLLCMAVFTVGSVKSQGIYFQAQVKKSASGSSLEFYIRPNATGGNITLKFDNLDFFIRWPSAEAAPMTGTPVVNTTDFPGLTITQQSSDNPYGNDPGFTIREWTSPSASSTNTTVTYVAGQEYLVFSVPVSNVISTNIELSGNNETGFPYYFTATKNTAGVGGQSDFTSHNSLNGNISNQLYYGNAAFLSNSGQNFYQKITASVLPVKFTSFTCVKKYTDAVLGWTVVNETAAVDRYEMERSLDGTIFNKINSFVKTSSSTNGNIYTYTDLNIGLVKSNGNIYYRIKQVDIDGRFVYSEIRNIKITDKNSIFSVYPNPVENITSLEINAPSEMKVTYSLISNDGRVFQKNTIRAAKGINTTIISLNNYEPGIYLLKVLLGNDIRTVKIIKK